MVNNGIVGRGSNIGKGNQGKWLVTRKGNRLSSSRIRDYQKNKRENSGRWWKLGL